MTTTVSTHAPGSPTAIAPEPARAPGLAPELAPAPGAAPTSAPAPAFGPAPTPAVGRAVGWIKVSVALTVVNALLLFFGSSMNFIFGMSWSYPIEDLFLAADQPVGALLVGILGALVIFGIAVWARTQPRIMLSLAAGFYLLGALVSIGLYDDFLGMATQLVIVVLAVLGAKSAGAPKDATTLNGFADPYRATAGPLTQPTSMDLGSAPVAPMAAPVPAPPMTPAAGPVPAAAPHAHPAPTGDL